MSNRDADNRYEAAQQSIPFFGRQLLQQVHTSLPGVVVEYDATTRRARVQPAVDLLLSPPDNPTADFADLVPMPKPVLLDVPVIFPAGGGYTVHFPLVKDDPVMLLFAERDIAAFKETLETGPPITDDVMEIQHAVAVPGFVLPNADDVAIPPPVIPPGTFPDYTYGATIQTNDGNTFVHLAADPNEIHARIVGDPVDETTYVRMTPQRVEATPDNDVTRLEMTPGEVKASADDGNAYFSIAPDAIQMRRVAHGSTPETFIRMTDNGIEADFGASVYTLGSGLVNINNGQAFVQITGDSISLLAPGGVEIMGAGGLTVNGRTI